MSDVKIDLEGAARIVHDVFAQVNNIENNGEQMLRIAELAALLDIAHSLRALKEIGEANLP